MGLIIIAIIVVLLIVIVGMYNGLVTSRNKVKNAWSQIETSQTSPHIPWAPRD